LILHNMAVIEHVASGEAATMYDVMGQPATQADQPEVTPRENMALQYVADATLPLQLERIQAMPLMQRVAVERWNQLHVSREHNSLTEAIGRELKQHYDDHKKSKCN